MPCLLKVLVASSLCLLISGQPDDEDQGNLTFGVYFVVRVGTEEPVVKKYLILFSLTLVVMLSFQSYSLLMPSGSKDIITSLVDPVLPVAGRSIEFPADVLSFSAQTWQQQLGCSKSAVKYIGFSGQTSARFAIVRELAGEYIYTAGDSFASPEKSRIIWMDQHRLILRTKEGVSVLCRDTSADGVLTLHVPARSAMDIKNKSVTGIIASTRMPVRPEAVEAGLPPEISTTDVIPAALSESSLSPETVVGYRLQQCRSYCWVLRQVSLQEGDVIQTIQGHTVAGMSPSQFKKLTGEDHKDITLTLVRKGQHITQVIPWEKLSPLLTIINEIRHRD